MKNNISQELKEKLKKVYELVKSGSTEGERAAANKALEKLLSKYKLEGIDLESIELYRYQIKYSTDLDVWLFERLNRTLLSVPVNEIWKDTWHRKELSFVSTYLDYVTLSSAYEYFRRHMKEQWTKFCAPNLKRCRTTKSRTKRREELKAVFFSEYVIASKLYQPAELTTVKWDDLTAKQQKDRIHLSEVEGGKFNRQVTNGLLLN